MCRRLSGDFVRLQHLLFIGIGQKITLSKTNMAQQVTPREFRQDEQYENDMENDEDFQMVQRRAVACLQTRQRTIKVLRRIAKEADDIHKGCFETNRDANITSAIGGVFGVLAGGITLFTGGTTAPFVIGTCAGGICSLRGSYSIIMNEKERVKRMSDLETRLTNQITEDNEPVEEFEAITCRIRNGDYENPFRIFRDLHMTAVSLGITLIVYDVGFALPPIFSFLGTVMQDILLQLMPKIFGAAFGSTGQEAAKTAVKAISEKITKEGAKKSVKKIAEETATTVAKEGIKTAAKRTVGFGLLTCAWEGYNARQNHNASKEESQLGKELRELANDMENNERTAVKEGGERAE